MLRLVFIQLGIVKRQSKEDRGESCAVFSVVALFVHVLRGVVVAIFGARSRASEKIAKLKCRVRRTLPLTMREGASEAEEAIRKPASKTSL